MGALRCWISVYLELSLILAHNVRSMLRDESSIIRFKRKSTAFPFSGTSLSSQLYFSEDEYTARTVVASSLTGNPFNISDQASAENCKFCAFVENSFRLTAG